ncbi:MAG: glutamine-hydrolyzing GMP synthase [Crenarchaeota archaeon]|nr:glutamine-hydrolyzing GMP synthase [Thermoproteota archaeon]
MSSAHEWKPYREHDTVLIVNFGGQYTHLIARRVRELNVYSEIVHFFQLSRDLINEIKPKALILSGGPSSVYHPNAPRIPHWVLDLEIPILGICYGHQLLATMLGGRVERGRGEYGRVEVEVLNENDILKGWSRIETVWMSHSDYVAELPPELEVLAVSRDSGYIAAFKHRKKPIYGVQFHPEVIHTPKGRQVIKNFVVNVASCRQSWRMENIVDRLIDEIRSRVAEGEKVLCAVSGGVDSTVTAVLVRKAVGDRLVAVFVNHGLLREGEAEEILSNLRSAGIDPLYIDASERFLSKLRGVSDPEEKRRIIGTEFARIFEEVARSDPTIKWLAQGTTYPDVIESGAVPGADRIKSHHNVGALPKDLGLKVLEPIRYLYKDEVRALGKALGLPDSIVKRHPFPGPGLAVRIIGEVTDEKLRIVRRASKIVEEEIRRAGLYDKVWQAFAVVGNDKWIGVKGDARAEGYIVIVRIVESEDGMTADWSKVPYEVLDRISRRITAEVPEVTMVTYAITTKPPSTIEPC